MFHWKVLFFVIALSFMPSQQQRCYCKQTNRTPATLPPSDCEYKGYNYPIEKDPPNITDESNSTELPKIQYFRKYSPQGKIQKIIQYYFRRVLKPLQSFVPKISTPGRRTQIFTPTTLFEFPKENNNTKYTPTSSDTMKYLDKKDVMKILKPTNLLNCVIDLTKCLSINKTIEVCAVSLLGETRLFRSLCEFFYFNCREGNEQWHFVNTNINGEGCNETDSKMVLRVIHKRKMIRREGLS